MEEKLDPYNHKQRFENWLKDKSIKGISKTNEKILLKFLDDMTLGLNVSKGSKKGARSFIRLNTLRQRMAFNITQLERRGIKDVTKTTPQQIHQLFEDMRSGVLKNRFGMGYKSVGDYIKVFKTFWHWHQKTSKDKIEDICSDLDTRGEKPAFVYLTKSDFENILKKADADLKPIIALAFDSGARVTELMNIKVSDFSNDFKELNIREETSKTFGRKIKLLLCNEVIKKYVGFLELKENDFLSKLTPPVINERLRALGKEVLKQEQIKLKNLTLYDFRHSSACFWLPKYKAESALKYRFGWIKSDMIHYYTEFLGMKDTIKQDDLYEDITKTELEKEVNSLKEQMALFKKGFEALKKYGLKRKANLNKSSKAYDEEQEEFIPYEKGKIKQRYILVKQ